jgi:SpoVK/Ycf46/Vps4 family AAA+-type ATPase
MPKSPRDNAPQEILTKSQEVALDLLTERAEAFFEKAGAGCCIKPRFNSLLIAPTGCGKTTLVQKLAKRVDAGVFAVSCAAWNVEASRQQPSTLKQLVEKICKYERLIVLIDEVDKWTSTDENSWVRFVSAEIWSTLDRKVEADLYFKDAEHQAALKKRLEECVYFIGAGTFEKIFAMAVKRTCVFAGNKETFSNQEILELIREHQCVSPELLSRFSTEPIVLRYPDLAETADLLRRTGLKELADRAEIVLEPSDIDWTGAGMRTLEQWAADLIIEERREQKRIQAIIEESERIEEEERKGLPF